MLIPITNNYYRAKQSDINILNDFSDSLNILKEGDKVFCEDSGAIYKVGKYENKENSPLCYILDTIEKVKYKTANPVCMSQDLSKFKGKRYIIKELPLDETSLYNNENIGSEEQQGEEVETFAIRIYGAYCTASVSVLTSHKFTLSLPVKDMVCFLIASNGVDFDSTYFETDTEQIKLVSTSPKITKIDLNYNKYSSNSNGRINNKLYIVRKSGLANTKIDIIILDKKWARHIDSSLAYSLRVKGILSASNLNSSGVFTDCKEIVNYSIFAYKYGLLSNIDSCKFTSNSNPSADKLISKDDYIFRGDRTTDNYSSSRYLLDTFVAEILD